MQASPGLAPGLKTKDISKPFAILLICNQTESQDAPQKVIATQKYASLLFYSALSYSLAVLSCFTHEGMWLSSPPSTRFSLHWQRPCHAVLEKILLPHESQEPESALEVLHFRRCVWGMRAETAGRGVRVELALPSAGYVRHLLKGVGPWQHEQT